MKNYLTYISFVTILIFWSGLLMALEEPSYNIVKSYGKVEIRRYAPFLIAKTVVTNASSQEEASGIGFRRLFQYISGENISMTSPVIQGKEKSVKIPMTAPVQQAQSIEGWAISFIVPAAYSLESTPKPKNKLVEIHQIPETHMAALRYSGRWTSANLEEHKKKLLDVLAEENITTVNIPVSAYYNAPFSLPIVRRNEVLVEIEYP
jgi:hypothetical protein